MIVTVTLNAALEVSYEAGLLSFEEAGDVSRARYRASGSGVTVARVLHKFGHDVLAIGLAGGTAGELITAYLAQEGVEADFTRIGRESRRMLRIAERDTGRVMRLREPGPYVTTEELGRFASDYRRLLDGATAVVLCGSLPAGLPTEIYGSLVSYAASAGVPAVLDAGGEELLHGARRRPDLVIPEGAVDSAARLLALGPGAVAIAEHYGMRALTADGAWTASVAKTVVEDALATRPAARGALVAGLVPGLLLGWSWPDRLRNAVALAVSTGSSGDVDLDRYERVLGSDEISVEAPAV